MRKKFNIIYSCIIALLVLFMFLLFSMQKSAQLKLDLQHAQETLEKKDLVLQETVSSAQRDKDKTKEIPILTNNITALESEINTYKKQLELLQRVYQQQKSLSEERSAELQALHSKIEAQQQFLTESERSKLTSEEKTSELSSALSESKELITNKEEQLNQLTAALEEKSTAITALSEKLASTQKALHLSETAKATNEMNLSLVLDELKNKSSAAGGTDSLAITDQTDSSSKTEMNLTLILDELVQRTQLANELQERIKLLEANAPQSDATPKNQEAIKETKKLFQETNSDISLNLSLILDELLAKTQLADELQARINTLSANGGFETSSTKIGAISEIQGLMNKMDTISLSLVEGKLLEANTRIQDLEISQAALQSTIDDQSMRILVLLDDLQTKENVLASTHDKLERQHLESQATANELEKLRAKATGTDKKLAELQLALDKKNKALAIQAKEAQATAGPLQGKIASLESQIRELLQTNATATNEKNNLKQEIISLESSLKEALAQVTLLTSDVQTAQAAIQQVENSRLSLTSETEGKRLALEQAQSDYAALSSAFAELENKLVSQTSLQTEKISTLEQQLADALSSNTVLAQEKKKTIAQLADLQATNESLTGELAQTKTSLQETLTQVALQQEENTRLSLSSVSDGDKIALGQAQEKITSLSNSISELKTELAEQTALQAEQAGLLEQQLAQALNSNKTLTEEKAAIANQLTLVTTEIQNAKTALKQEEQTRLSLASATEEENKRALQQAQDKITSLTDTVAGLETQLTDSINSNKLLLEEKNAVANQLVSLPSAKAALTKEHSPSDAALEESRGQIELLTTKFEAAKAEKQQALEKYASLSDKYTKLEAEIQNENAAKAEEISSLQSLLQQQAASTETIQGESEAKISETTASLKEALEQSAALKTEVDQLMATISEQDQTIEKLTSSITDKSSDAAQKNTLLSQEIAAAKTTTEKQLAEHTARITEQENSILELSSKLAENVELLSTAQTNIEQLNAQLTEKDSTITKQQQEILILNEIASATEEDSKQETETLSLPEDNMTTLQEPVEPLTEESEQLLPESSDSDKDGINDNKDTCPGTIQGATVNSNGCEEDTDNDGLANRLDLCPGTAEGSTIDSTGCAADQETVILKGISFQFGTADLAQDAHSILDAAAVILQSNPDIYMEVAGHTDSSGDSTANIRLSTQRAEAVVSYLISAGVAAERLQAKGYGSDNPIADNASREGRAQNRRVELKKLVKDPAPESAEPTQTPTNNDAETAE